MLTCRDELRALRNRFVTQSSSEYHAADADEIAGLLDQARRQK